MGGTNVGIYIEQLYLRMTKALLKIFQFVCTGSSSN